MTPEKGYRVMVVSKRKSLNEWTLQCCQNCTKWNEGGPIPECPLGIKQWDDGTDCPSFRLDIGCGSKALVERYEREVRLCHACDYWHKQDKNIGECRCNAPTPSNYAPNNPKALWPHTLDSDWCGDYKGRV